MAKSRKNSKHVSKKSVASKKVAKKAVKKVAPKKVVKKVANKKVANKKVAKRGTKKAPKKSTKKVAVAVAVADAVAVAEVSESPKATISSNDRHFKRVTGINDKTQKELTVGRFKGSKPKQAANKAFTSLLKELKEAGEDTLGEFTFSIKECTRGSSQKIYHYIGKRTKLDEPMEVPIFPCQCSTCHCTSSKNQKKCTLSAPLCDRSLENKKKCGKKIEYTVCKEEEECTCDNKKACRSKVFLCKRDVEKTIKYDFSNKVMKDKAFNKASLAQAEEAE